jgi:hypothetical protein
VTFLNGIMVRGWTPEQFVRAVLLERLH